MSDDGHLVIEVSEKILTYDIGSPKIQLIDSLDFDFPIVDMSYF